MCWMLNLVVIFLVDSGTEISIVVPTKSELKRKSNSMSLVSIDGSVVFP